MIDEGRKGPQTVQYDIPRGANVQYGQNATDAQGLSHPPQVVYYSTSPQGFGQTTATKAVKDNTSDDICSRSQTRKLILFTGTAIGALIVLDLIVKIAVASTKK